MKIRISVAVLSAALILSAAPAEATNGHVLHGSGAINESLGGAGVANAFDVLGASINPATLRGIRNQAALHVEFFSPDRYLSSRVSASAFGPSFGPPVDLNGSTHSSGRLSILPAAGLAYTPENSRTTFGAIFQGIAGFGVDYDVSALTLSGGGINPKANPILTPQPPGGFGFGHIFSDYKLITLKLIAATAVSERLTLGVSLIPALSELQVDPFPATNPVDGNGDTFPTYPNTGFDKAWGFGFQLGATYQATDRLRLGANLNSPIWFESFRWTVRDEGASSRRIRFNLDYPAIASVGAAYKLRPDTVLLVDVRRIFYSQTSGFDTEGFASDGSVRGFGWESIWVVGTGVQYTANDRLRFRLGYNYNNNPVPSRLSFFNVEAPAIMKHRLTAGVGFTLSDLWKLDVSYYHAFQSSLSGPFVSPAGAVPGTSVGSRMTEDSLAFQLTRFFED